MGRKARTKAASNLRKHQWNVYYPNGVQETLLCRKNPPLEKLQMWVGGYVEKVGKYYVNEDGLQQGLPRNPAFPQFVGVVVEQVE